MPRLPSVSVLFASALLTLRAVGAPVINEIMFQPLGTPAENPAQEWIEIFNPDAVAANVAGWKFSKGVAFTIPAATTIPAGGYLVVAADVAVFSAAHPGFTGVLLGGWTGRMSNSGEQLQLDNAAGTKVCDVSYADSGDWARRGRGALSDGHRGWAWFSEAAGGGKTLELRNPALGIGSGQNWGVSTVVGGTPGAVNTLASANLAPLIKDAKHRPEIPKSTDPIVVSCDLEDEAVGAVATLHWRLDGGTFDALPMTDTDGDGDVEATIPAQANLSIIEWYISATDGANVRTWPAAARTSDSGVPETFAQVTNALAQVDDSYDASATFQTAASNPTYRMILTLAERNELVQLQTTSGQEHSEARFNATFISHDGTGVKLRYNCAIGNRGQSSALGPPNNYHVGFSGNALWNGRSTFGLNSRFPYSQALGAALYTLSGIAPQDTAVVKARLNGVDMAQNGATMFSRYARIEGRGSDWAANHFPHDSDGNFYRLDYHYPSVANVPLGNLVDGEFRYEGLAGASYADTFIKENNTDANDFSDLISLCKVVSASRTADSTAGDGSVQPLILDAAYPAAVATVLDLDETYRFFAVDALIGNMEGGLQNGGGDDASLYRGVLDPRFKFIPHDMDTIFDIGDTTGGVSRNIFSYDGGTSPGTGVLGLTRLFNHPQLVPRYYAALLDALNTWFSSATINPVVDQIMAGWVPSTDGVSQNRSITDIKAYVTNRRTNVLAQIQQNYSLVTTVGGATSPEGYLRTNDGAATFSGTFNVVKTYSITVNGVAATASYRTTGTTTAGNWSLAVAAGGGTVLHPGLNDVIVRFWDGIGGTGAIVKELTALVLYQPASAIYTNVSGTLAAGGSVAMTAPASYIPGIPFLVKVDLKNAAGALDRTAWNRTANLTATNGVTLSPATVALTNGVGSALVTVGATGSGTVTQLIQPGGTAAAPNASAPQWRMLDNGAEPAVAWKSSTAFDDSLWTLGPLQAGAGDGDERTVLNNVPTNLTTRRAFYFRKVFNVADPLVFTALEIRAVVDDGAVFYLNGTQVAIDNVAASPTITTPATSNRAGAAESAINTYNITAFLGALVSGNNVLSVEVHNYHVTGTPSADLSFDCELRATAPGGGGSDPGNFTLTSAVGTLSAAKAITSLTPTPVMTNVSGALSGGTTTWSGVMNVTGDVTVPATGTLNIAAGTHILMAGNSTAGSTAGAKFIVTTGGIVNAAGTAAQPISITANAAANRWGEINTNGATTTWQYCLVSHAGHSTGGGHTGTAPCVRLSNGANFTFDDGVITDLPGKILTNTGNTTLTLRRSHFGRCVMGPELDGSKVTIQDSNFTEMLPAYRESGAQDDEDCIYIHDSGDPVLRPVLIERSVFSNSGDDGIDCLAGTLTVQDSIIRNITDKGMSLLQNQVTVRRTQFVDCDFGISCKTQIGAEATPYTVTLENCTIIGEVHATNLGDQSAGTYWHSVGIHVRNKYGTGPNAQLFVVAKNCIVSAVTPMLNDYAAGGNNFPLLTSTYNCYEDVTGTNPVDPAPPAGTGDLAVAPLFVDAVNKDFHLQAGSPCRNTGDPASPLDTDGSRADMGALPFGVVIGGAGSLTWTPAGGPYRVTAAITVPSNLTLTIQAGTAVYFDQNVRMTVNGNVQALGTPDRRITFSSVPGVVAAGDADPIKLLTQTGPPKWGGIRVTDSMATESVFKYCDFLNAQGTDPLTAENYGSLGFIRSWGFCEGLTFAGTHLRMLYGRNPKLTVIRCNFPDMFNYDPVLGRIEEPTTDFLATADNKMEPLKVEYPVEAETIGAAWSVNGLPIGGWWRVYYSDFHGNRGHQDVFDADSGRVNVAGDFLLDCRYNYFHGLAGDEHIDLGGDAYIASNILERANKDYWTNDTGYSNAISSGDKGSGTTIMVARNLCFDLDHVINCKLNTATIFEHNTVANLHADFNYVGSTVTQNVVCAPVNFFIPNDGSLPTYGDGAYMGFNIVSNVNHLFSGPDARRAVANGPVVNDITTKIEFFNNLLDQITDPVIGPNHAGGYFSGTYGPNTAGAPGFIDSAAKNYSLTPASLARGTAPGGFDYGASIPEWAYIVGGPNGSTAATSASFTIGGAGIVAYKWRLDGGAWSSETVIGTGTVFPRTVGVPCVRQATLALSSLSAGGHTLEVLGRDMAGNWQDADPARTVIGATQAAATARTWTVDPAFVAVQLNEILADSATLADSVELRNTSGAAVTLTGWSLTDDPLVPNKVPLTGSIANGAYATFTSASLGLDKDGDSLYLYQGATLRDSLTFGQQITDKTIGRNASGAWVLCSPTLGAANTPLPVGDASTVKLSEWLASSDVLYGSDWVELQNTSASPAALEGLRVTDNRVGDASAYVFPPLSFIAGSGYVRLVADGANSPGHLPFGLDAEYQNLTLLTASGALLDTVSFYPQTTDYSMGRDATGALIFYELPTRGFANGTADPAYANALALLRGLRITEVMYNALGGSEYDYVELRNVGATALQLGGMRFVSGIDFTFPTTTLAAGQNLLVVKNVTKFRNRYGNGPLVAGSYTGQLDNGGEKLGLQLPPPFDANVMTFTYSDTWQPTTDGAGRSLIVANPLLAAGLWNDKDTWAASATNGGDPNGAAVPTLGLYADWAAVNGALTVTADGDFDGLGALVEFGLGMNPASPVGGDGAAGAPAAAMGAGGHVQLVFLVPDNASATQLHGLPEVTYTVLASSDLVTWSTVATKTFPTAWTGAATVTIGTPSGGYTPVSVQDSLTGPQRFLRLQVTWTP